MESRARRLSEEDPEADHARDGREREMEGCGDITRDHPLSAIRTATSEACSVPHTKAEETYFHVSCVPELYFSLFFCQFDGNPAGSDAPPS